MFWWKGRKMDHELKRGVKIVRGYAEFFLHGLFNVAKRLVAEDFHKEGEQGFFCLGTFHGHARHDAVKQPNTTAYEPGRGDLLHARE